MASMKWIGYSMLMASMKERIQPEATKLFGTTLMPLEILLLVTSILAKLARIAEVPEIPPTLEKKLVKGMRKLFNDAFLDHSVIEPWAKSRGFSGENHNASNGRQEFNSIKLDSPYSLLRYSSLDANCFNCDTQSIESAQCVSSIKNLQAIG